LPTGNKAYKKIQNIYYENTHEDLKPRQNKKSQINPSNPTRHIMKYNITGL
jgi:hypothetical protein